MAEMEKPAITSNDVLDVHNWMQAHPAPTLADLGWDPELTCKVRIVRWVGLTSREGSCIKDRGHAGDCDPGW